jgi:hypothetical protein
MALPGESVELSQPALQQPIDEYAYSTPLVDDAKSVMQLDATTRLQHGETMIMLSDRRKEAHSAVAKSIGHMDDKVMRICLYAITQITSQSKSTAAWIIGVCR